MVADCEVWAEGCICEIRSDISTDWRDMRSEFGYTTLCAMWLSQEIKNVHFKC